MAQAAGGVGLFDIDFVAQVIRCSEHFFHLVGRTPSPDRTITFADWETWVHPDDHERVVDETLAALSSAAPRMATEYRIVGENRETHWVFCQSEIHRDAQGNAVRKIGAIQDITARGRVEDQLREAHERLHKVINSMFAFVWVLAADGTLIEANQAPIAAAGLNRAELIGRKLWDCPWWSFDPDVRARLQAAFQRALHGETVRYDETMATAYAGRWTVDFMLQPVFTHGELEFVIPSAVDITDRKRAEDALKQSDRHKDEFLATLAHELRNPLAPLRTGIEVMKRSSDPATVERTRGMMERQIQHMVRLIDDLLDISRIGRGKIELKREQLSITRVIEHAVETTRPAIEAGRHLLDVHGPPEPVWVNGDLTRLAQVVGNLLNNSAKYTPDGGRIELSVRVERNQAVIRVADNGIGIAAKLLPRVFDLFEQSSDCGGRTRGGLGIGLALVRRLVELHGGSVAAHSLGVGRGSTFTVRLPLAPPPAQQAETARPEPCGEQAKRRRVLVVDDNEDAAELLATMLDLHGYETRTAHDGPGALQAIAAFAPDLVFLDIGLPGMSGHEVAQTIRATPGGAGIVLVAVTGWGGSDAERRTQASGFDFHLTKPVELAAIQDVLRRLG